MLETRPGRHASDAGIQIIREASSQCESAPLESHHEIYVPSVANTTTASKTAAFARGFSSCPDHYRSEEVSAAKCCRCEPETKGRSRAQWDIDVVDEEGHCVSVADGLSPTMRL
jgi:hypothetical protein